jgi:hypothetical protein
MKKTYYVLVQEYQFDSGEHELEVIGVYKTLKEAKEHQERLVNESELWWKNYYEGEYCKESGDNSITFYESDNYCYNHENIIIFAR